jgi:HSP20 family protein
MLMRFDPFREFDALAQLLTRQGGTMRSLAMPMDAYRDGDQFIVNIDLPGVDPEAIDLSLERNELTVRAERQWEPQEHQQVLIAERPQGEFTRQLFLGDSLDGDGMRASYDKGVLTLTIPVAEQAKPRKVEVSASGQQHAIRTGATAN